MFNIFNANKQTTPGNTNSQMKCKIWLQFALFSIQITKHRTEKVKDFFFGFDDHVTSGVLIAQPLASQNIVTDMASQWIVRHHVHMVGGRDDSDENPGFFYIRSFGWTTGNRIISENRSFE